MALAVPEPKPEAKPEPKPDPKADPQFSRVSVTSGQTPYAYSVAHVPAAYYADYPGGPFAYSGYPGGYYPGAAPYYSPYAYSPYGYNPYSAFRYY